MLRLRFSKAEFQNIFQSFNNAVYSGEYKKLNYKSWRNIQAWSCDEKWQEIEISKEWVRCRDENATHNYAYYDEERIFVGPYHKNYIVPNPEELDPNDDSFGAWLDLVLNENTKMPEHNYSTLATDCAWCDYSDSTASKNNWYNTHDTISIDSGWQQARINADTVYVNDIPLQQYVENIVKNNEIKKENKEMKFNFDFGPVDSSVRMSLYGMAIKNAAGTYVAYDANSKQVMDVDILNFEGANKLMYKMPVALKDVRSGDVVVHNRKPCFVQMVCDDNRFKVLDIFDGEEKTIVPARSPFGWDFLTKVVCLYNFNNADTNNPFGNMLPLLLLSDGKTDDMLPFLLMSQNGANFTTNPMLMYALMSGKGNNDMLPFLLMSGFNAPAAAKPE